MRTPSRRTTTALLTAALFVAGCGAVAENVTERIAEEAIEAGNNGEVDVDIDGGEDGSITVTGEDGTSTFSSGGDIPTDWPDEVVFPDGIQLITQSSLDGGDEGSTYTYNGVIESGAVSEDVLAAIESRVLDLGYEEQSSTEFTQNGQTTYNKGWTSGDSTVNVIIGQDDDGSVTVIYSANVVG